MPHIPAHHVLDHQQGQGDTDDREREIELVEAQVSYQGILDKILDNVRQILQDDGTKPAQKPD